MARDGKYYRLHSAIANLIVPVGALVVVADAATAFHPYTVEDAWTRGRRKMRASRAQVHSIVRLGPRTEVTWAVSKHDMTFDYFPQKVVRPRDTFDRTQDQCSSGIHFFLNVQDALQW